MGIRPRFLQPGISPASSHRRERALLPEGRGPAGTELCSLVSWFPGLPSAGVTGLSISMVPGLITLHSPRLSGSFQTAQVKAWPGFIFQT